MSSVQGGNSGNRGRCSQPCRDPYITTSAGKNFPLNLKDNSAYFDIRELAEAGVDSVKIEGRIKKFHYVYTVVKTWKKQIQSLYQKVQLTNDNRDLYKVFNRDFTNAYLTGDSHQSMFIDNPRDHSAIHRAEMNGGCTDANIEQAKQELYDEKTEIINHVRAKIEQLINAKAPLVICISGECGAQLKVTVKTPDTSFEVLSEINLANIGAEALNHGMLLSRLKALNDTEYYIEHLEMGNLNPNLYLPFKELTAIKKKLLFILNGSKETVDPIDVPVIQKQISVEIKPTLAVLISSSKDLHLCQVTAADICFQLPNSLKNESDVLLDMFRQNKKLIPWFPSVLIGDDYTAAVEFLQQVRPMQIVTNNTGIAYEAWQRGISWIAGPYLNLVNSFSLICLKENFNCAGAFISNEISKTQLQQIKKPENFKLYYSIYHPIALMTSRQCLFQQVTGCEKSRLDNACIQHCEKSACITNLKKVTYYLEKAKGDFHCIYNETNFLNSEIVTDLPNLFSGFLIDLRDVKTETKTGMDKSGIVKLFENHLNGNTGSANHLRQQIHPTTNSQYTKGI